MIRSKEKQLMDSHAGDPPLGGSRDLEARSTAAHKRPILPLSAGHFSILSLLRAPIFLPFMRLLLTSMFINDT